MTRFTRLAAVHLIFFLRDNHNLGEKVKLLKKHDSRAKMQRYACLANYNKHNARMYCEFYLVLTLFCFTLLLVNKGSD